MTYFNKYDIDNIIENHLSCETQEKVKSSLENYFEIYLNTDMKIIMSDYINQVMISDNIDHNIIIDVIDTQLQNYLIKTRNNIRSFIKKDNFNLNSLNKFIKTFIVKIYYINNIIRSPENKFIKSAIQSFRPMILFDSYILSFIQDKIILLSTDLQNEIKLFLKQIYELEKYYETIYDSVIEMFISSHKKQMINDDFLPLSINIKRIHKLNDNIKYLNAINYYYKSINLDIIKYNFPIIEIIFENLIDIIKNNSLSEIEFVLNNIDPELTTICSREIIEIDKLLNQLIDELHLLINKYNQDNVFQIINIIKYFYNIVIHQQYKFKIADLVLAIMINDKVVDNILDNINILIIENKQYEATSILNFISHINIKDKDIFINKYYQLLMQRLLSIVPGFKFTESDQEAFEKYIKLERVCLTTISSRFCNKLVYKLFKIIQDVDKSYNDSKIFYNDNIIENKNIIITMSYNNWEVNQTEGIITELNENSYTSNLITKYNNFYKKENNKILNWYPHYGEVNITYQKCDIRMLPIHFMVLELFNNTDKLLQTIVNDALFFKNYSSKFKNNIINSLIVSKLLIPENEYLVLSTKGPFENNIIDLFFTINDYALVWEQKKQDNFAHTREEIICANINNIIKRSPMNREDLFDAVRKKNNIFDTEESIFDKALNYMIRMDYIQKTNNLYEKIYY